MKYLKKFKELDGKTIKHAKQSKFDHNPLYLTFQDEDRAIISASPGYEGDVNLSLRDDPSEEEMLIAGWMTQEEYNQWDKDRIKKDELRRKQRELQELKRLKEKYEK